MKEGLGEKYSRRQKTRQTIISKSKCVKSEAKVGIVASLGKEGRFEDKEKDKRPQKKEKRKKRANKKDGDNPWTREVLVEIIMSKWLVKILRRNDARE